MIRDVKNLDLQSSVNSFKSNVPHCCYSLWFLSNFFFKLLKEILENLPYYLFPLSKTSVIEKNVRRIKKSYNLLWECIKAIGLLRIRKSYSHSWGQWRMKNYSSTFIPSSKIHRWYCSYTLAIYNHIFRADSVPRKLKMLTKLAYKEKQTKLQLHSKAKKAFLKTKISWV